MVGKLILKDLSRRRVNKNQVVDLLSYCLSKVQNDNVNINEDLTEDLIRLRRKFAILYPSYNPNKDIVLHQSKSMGALVKTIEILTENSHITDRKKILIVIENALKIEANSLSIDSDPKRSPVRLVYQNLTTHPSSAVRRIS